MIGDVDPEDAYDATDPVTVRLVVVARIIAALHDDPARTLRRRVEVVRLLRRIADEVEAGG